MAAEIYQAIQDASNKSSRSKQSSSFQLGISDIGFCHERMRRSIAEIPAAETDALAAFLGTAIGDHVEKAILEHLWPDAILQSEVTVKLVGDGGRTYEVSGHPDILRPSGLVCDAKTTFGLEEPRRMGPSRQQRIQRVLYALGAANKGVFDVPLEEVMVANVWIDRSGVSRECYVDIEPFDWDLVAEASRFVDDVVYAHLNGEQAEKDPPRDMCRKVCGHFEDCRGYELPSGLIEDPWVIEAAKMYDEGRTMASTGNRLKKEAKAALQYTDGTTGEFAVRWTRVPATDTRGGYDKLSVTRLKK